MEFKRGLELSSESVAHPHSVPESADLFSSVGFEPTEVEYLDVIHSLVRAAKPNCVLETGSYHGLSAAAIGFALKQNSNAKHHGLLISLEKEGPRADRARALVEEVGLASFVRIMNVESISYISGEYSGPPFEIIYFDSSRSVRAIEFEALRSRSLIAMNALLFFHDTSPHRALSMPNQTNSQQQYLSSLDQVSHYCSKIVLALSRGLTVMQFTGGAARKAGRL